MHITHISRVFFFNFTLFYYSFCLIYSINIFVHHTLTSYIYMVIYIRVYKKKYNYFQSFLRTHTHTHVYILALIHMIYAFCNFSNTFPHTNTVFYITKYRSRIFLFIFSKFLVCSIFPTLCVQGLHSYYKFL